MPTLTTVFVWPPTGFAHEQWEDSAEQDSLLRTSRRVCDRFSIELAAEKISATTTEIRMFSVAWDGTALEVSAVEQKFEGFECGHMYVPRDFHKFSTATRTSLVADAVELLVSRLGEVRGWDVAAIHRAMDRVRAADYNCEYTSPWKSAPNRSVKARITSRLLDDGFGRARFEFSDGSASDEFVANSTYESFKRLGRELRWADNTTVKTAEQMSVFTGKFGESSVREGWMDFAPRQWKKTRKPRPNDGERGLTTSIPRVVLRARPAITVGSGMGPMNGVPRAYNGELDRLIDVVCDSELWLEWWRLSAVREVFLPVHFGDVTEKLIARLRGENLTVRLYRPTASIPRGTAGVALARADVLSIVGRAQARLGLPAHPTLG